MPDEPNGASNQAGNGLPGATVDATVDAASGGALDEAPRALRGLVPLEVAAVLAVAIVPWPDRLPVALPLLVAGSLSRWMRGRTWSALVPLSGGRAAASAAAGLIALFAAVLAGTPIAEALTDRAVAWSAFPTVRGDLSQLVAAALIVTALAIASELALRGWIVERVLELSPGPSVLPVLVGAIAEALVTPGDLAVRIGAGVFGLGLGGIYVAAGRSATAAICARAAFGLGAAVLEALRVIG